MDPAQPKAAQPQPAPQKAGGAPAGAAATEEFRKVMERNTHLQHYIAELTQRGFPTPRFKLQLSKSVLDEGKPNIIYPVTEPIFVHLYKDDDKGRIIYCPIEPIIPIKSVSLLKAAEEAIAFRITKNFEFKTQQEHITKLKEILQKCSIVNPKLKDLGQYEYDDRKRIIAVNEETLKGLEYTLVKEKVGYGVIDPLIRDPYLEDISCDGKGFIFVEHKIFQSCDTTLNFDSVENLDEYSMRLSERIGRPANFRRPIIDGTLPDGSRINIVYGTDLSLKGTNFTIRKFTAIPISITQICASNTMNFMEAAYLWLLLEHNMNMWICGETASGKTTTVKAVLTFVKPTAKIVTIEDTPELQVPHDNWIREMTRQGEDAASSIDIFDLLKAALRQRPNYIVVGEIRGKEGLIAFQAMQTGHGVMATFHASSVIKLVQRLTGYPIEVPKTYVDLLNAVVFQNLVRIPKTGKTERRVTSINEIIGFDPTEQSYNFIELFAWDPITDTHEFRGMGSSYVLEEKIAPLKGITRKRIKDIYLEVDNRAEILRLMAQKKVFDYYDVWGYMNKINSMGTENMLKMLRQG
jgi:flagellar protein FlaI